MISTQSSVLKNITNTKEHQSMKAILHTNPNTRRDHPLPQSIILNKKTSTSTIFSKNTTQMLKDLKMKFP